MPLKIVEPITKNQISDLFGKTVSRGKHFAEGKMSEEALLCFIYDSSKIHNLDVGFYKKCLIVKQKQQYKLDESFIDKIRRMFNQDKRPKFVRIPNSLSLNYFNEKFNYTDNVIILKNPDNSQTIRDYVLSFKPKSVAVDAETCAIIKAVQNRAYDYIAFAFSYNHVFLWYRPKTRYLKGLFKFLKDLNVCVLHWGPGDEKAFVQDQLSQNLQPIISNGQSPSLSDAAIIVTGHPLDKGK
uniref:Uncharacterized protein n=1 Tax=Panagrolaimus sp. ES5 TaxID=591445 RepID=A0AC34FS50_9BILA